ncbi:MAG: TrmB family transcriptional regulator [Candidatus Woesearchaeota archaeon]
MDAQKLQEVGLTEGESKVYLALSELKESTTGDIIQKSGVSSSKVYDILERLSKKGLVSIQIKNNTKHFQAKAPQRILDFLHVQETELKQKKQQAKQLIQELQAIQSRPQQTQYAEILQGIQGIKTFLEYFLQELQANDTMYIIGANKESIDLMGEYFSEWHTRRVHKEVTCLATYLPEATSRARFRKQTPLTQTRILPKTMKAPAFFVIGRDISSTFIFGGSPLCIVVKNQQVAQSYEEYFKLLWEQSTPP